ncbi:DNA oxidative demethylase ALKBH2 isoform X2 [Sapajus apella]|uniref:DNA oxidative demethylase ALKBH2 isoform X2 n=1 Tax=Sapajus apella TaxID=9515 RepID=A0A6J3JQC0_SAPAP|nr:DNA oxidative demethylase ALKBH2 isoform X2 [Sapajus apella]XP_032156680.1 DNA oxidative demethylase ALKBH2 isoform X2 [Sapajus apella]
MDRFLVKGAEGGLLRKREEQEATGEEPLVLGGDQESTRKRPRREAPENGGHSTGPSWRYVRAEGLNCSYTVLFGKAEADEIFQELEKEVEYFTGIKMAVTTSGSTETMKENWPLGAPSPLSPSVPAETLSSGIRIPVGKAPRGGWRWSGCRWPTEAYS